MSNHTPAADAPQPPRAGHVLHFVEGVIPDGIPAELRAGKRWVLWRYETRNGRPTKVPYQADGRLAKTDDPTTWATFDAVLAAYQRGGYDGIGRVFAVGTGEVGIDLDKCRNPHTGVIEPWAQAIIDQANTYAEVSPSGTGVKLWGRGSLANWNLSKNGTGRKKKKYHTGALEVYRHHRYFAMTGHRLPGCPDAINDCQAVIDRLWAEVFAPQRPAPKPSRNGDHTPAATAAPAKGHAGMTASEAGASDREIYKMLHRSKVGSKVDALWTGDTSVHGNDDSSADLALCNYLAWAIGPDPARIDAMFRNSGLMRTKWDEVHFADGRTYGQATIDLALADRRDYYDWSPTVESKIDGGPPVVEEASEASAESAHKIDDADSATANRDNAQAAKPAPVETAEPETPAADPARENLLAIVRRRLGIPEFAGVVQIGVSDASYQLRFALPCGAVSVGLATTEQLMSQTKVRARVGEALGRLPPPVKREHWPRVVDAILKLREVRESSSNADDLRDWLEDYVATRHGWHEKHAFTRGYSPRNVIDGGTEQDWREQRNEGVPEKYSTERLTSFRAVDGSLYLSLMDFQEYLTFDKRNVKPADLKALLVAVGFHHEVLRGTNRRNKTRPGRRYWVHPTWFDADPDGGEAMPDQADTADPGHVI